MDEDTLIHFDDIDKSLRNIIYSIKHHLLCYNGLTGDLLKAELCDGTLHCSKNADKFMESLFQEYMERGINTYLRGDSGFSLPKLYKTCEMNGCSYAIHLKKNSSLVAFASNKDEDLYKATKEEQSSKCKLNAKPHTFVQLIQLVQTTDTSCKYAKATG